MRIEPNIHTLINQDAWVEDPGGIQRALGGPQRDRERLRPLPVIPGPVVATDGVVMGDGAAVRHGSASLTARLDLVPLLDLGARADRRRRR